MAPRPWARKPPCLEFGVTLDLEFEAPLAELNKELGKAKAAVAGGDGDVALVGQLQARVDAALRELYAGLTAWQKVQVARHPQRPLCLDYLRLVFTDFTELHGDRRFGDDAAIVGGPAFLDGRSVMVVGQQRGHDTRENSKRNFAMPGPEGYRKAQRLFALAEKLGLPVITMIDTPGANVGVADEERGQVEAIASSIAAMCSLKVPIVSVVIGQGNSGGALAIGVADRIIMLEHSTYSVATPEAAASIMWRSAQRAEEAAEAMRITAQDMLRFGIADQVLEEPLGGAHRDPTTMAVRLRDALIPVLDELLALGIHELLETRYRRYRAIGRQYVVDGRVAANSQENV
jgi:acetyl-CoA carboxylase carboxyl transferase subunit alpha